MKQISSIKKTPGERTFDFANIVILILLGIVTLYPMMYVAFASISNSNLLMQHSGFLVRPLGFNLSAYRLVFKNPNIISGFRNSLIILGVGVPLNLVMTALGAYFLSLSSTIFPFLVGTFNLIIMRTSFAAIPESLEESAKLDGAGHITILFRIVIPLSKAVIAVMILYYGVEKWNGWFWASTFITNRSLHPIQVVLRGILINNDTSLMVVGMAGADMEEAGESIKYATTMVATVPILLIYPFIQKYFVKGVMIGAVKG